MLRPNPWRYWAAGLLALLLWWPLLALAASEAGKVLATRGEVAAATADGQSRPLKRGDSLFQGDTVITGADSFVRIRFSDGGSLHLRATTRFAISEYAFEEDGKQDVGRFDLVAGGFRAVTGVIGRDDKAAYSVKTPVTTIGIRGTDHEGRYCNGDCSDLADQGITPPEDGLYNGTFEGETVINGEGFGPGQYGYTNPDGVTTRLPEPPAILTGDPMPDPSDDTEYEGLGADADGGPQEGDEGEGATEQAADQGPTTPAGPTGDDGPGDGGSPGTEPTTVTDGTEPTTVTDGTGPTTVTDGTGPRTVTDGTEGGEQLLADSGFFTIPEREQQVLVLECPL